jgi:hypothetical protein
MEIFEGNRSLFQCMKYVGYSPQAKTKYQTIDTTVYHSRYYDLFKASSDDSSHNQKILEFEQLGQCGVSSYSKEKYLKSLKKCDVLPKKPTNSAFDLAIEFTKQHLEFLINTKISSGFDVNWDTSSGVPYDRDGKPLKGDFKKTPGYIQQEFLRKHDPIWKVPPKKEYLPHSELEEGKLRTFFIPDFPFLLHQKLVWEEQNARLLYNHDKCWSKFGYSKQYGGFDRLMKSLQKKSLRWTVDVSGWDRVLPLLPEVYKIRRHFLNFGDSNNQYLNWIERNTCYPFISLEDGSIYQRMCGNGSGSNNTSEDNTIAHIIIMFYLLISLYFHFFNVFPTYEEIDRDALAGLYGDDKIAALDWLNFCKVQFDEEFFKNFVIGIYEEFGMTVKKSQFVVQYDEKLGPLDGLEFLGSTARFDYKRNVYVPEPRISKIATSLRGILTSDDTEDVLISKLTAAYELCFFGLSNHCKFLILFIKDFSHYLINLNSLTIKNSIVLQKIITDTHPVEHLLYGWEANN